MGFADKGPRPWSTIYSLSDGSIRTHPWELEGYETLNGKVRAPGEEPLRVYHSADDGSACFVTAMTVSRDRKWLFAGMNNGVVRAYPWPPEYEEGDLYYIESIAHYSAVVQVIEAPTGHSVLSIGEEGSIFIHKFVREGQAKDTKKAESEGKSGISALADMMAESIYPDPDILYNNNVVLMSCEDVDEHVNEILDLQKKLKETQQKFEFDMHNKEAEFANEIKRLNESSLSNLNNERLTFESIKGESDRKVKELLASIQTKDMEHIKFTSELENRYEHKLAEQMERYDRLAEDMESLKQRCEEILVGERGDFTHKLSLLEHKKAKEMKLATDKLNRERADKDAQIGSFQEILTQQEDEYEDELRQLIAAAEAELNAERDSVFKLKMQAQTKDTKIEQMEKKLREVNDVLKARNLILEKEREEQRKLRAEIAHNQKNIQERDEALAEKEKTILELRNTARTLENFRFVLDHRLHQLSNERGPITNHIGNLERHITSMYEEMVRDGDQKTAELAQSAAKDRRIEILNKEVMKARSDSKVSEQYIQGFKKDLSNVANSMSVGKELEETVRVLYKKYVRGEKVASKVLQGTHNRIQDQVCCM
jgi:hypothetical protein